MVCRACTRECVIRSNRLVLGRTCTRKWIKGGIRRGEFFIYRPHDEYYATRLHNSSHFSLSLDLFAVLMTICCEKTMS